MNGTQVCSYEGPRLFPIEHNNETDLEEIHGRNLNTCIFFLRSTGSFSTKLGPKHSWMMGIQVCPHPFSMGR